MSWRHHWPDTGVTVTSALPGEPRPLGDGLLQVDGGLDVTVDLDPATSSRLVSGYQSWDYAGVRPAAEAGHTWWGGAVADRAGGQGLAFHAATSERAATSFSTEPTGDGRLRVTSTAGGTPELVPAPPSWGFFSPPAVTTPGIEPEPVILGPTLEAVAAAVGRAAGALRWEGPPMTGWESWYHYGFSVTPETMLENGRILVDRLGPGLLQLDDGWQRAYGDWRPGDAWPDDLRDFTAEVEALGCRPGLWLAPFMVWPGGPGMGQRPDLLIGGSAGKGGEGTPRTDPLMARHGVDASHPEAVAWLEELGATVRRWGFSMVKLDFLYIGALEGARHDPAVTGTEALRRGLAAFRRGLGDDVYVLGCGMPMLPAAGLCHGNRIGGDLCAPALWPFPELVPYDQSSLWPGVLPQVRNLAARAWMHGRLFDVDPDVVMAWRLAPGEAHVLATAAALAGGSFLLADDLADLSPEQWDALVPAEVTGLAWSNEGCTPLDLFAHVDATPLDRAEFFAQPTDLPPRWAAQRGTSRVQARFDWDARTVTLS